MANNGHSKLGPSGAKRWMYCTASVGLIDKHEVVSESGDAAREGTAAHLVLEHRLMKKLIENGHCFDKGRFTELSKEIEELYAENTSEVSVR